MISIYSKGKTVTSLDLHKLSAKRKLKEIAVLEEFISKCDSVTWQMIAMNRMNELIKEVIR